MKLDHLTEERLISISDSIRHVAVSNKGHLPDKISSLKTNINLIEMEIDRLKKLNN